MNPRTKQIIDREVLVAEKTIEKLKDIFGANALSPSYALDEIEALTEYISILKSTPTVALGNLIGQINVITSQPLPELPDRAGYVMSSAVKDTLIATLLDGINSSEVLLALVRQKNATETTAPRSFEIRIQCDTTDQVVRVANLLREAGLMDYDQPQTAEPAS